MLLHVSVAGDPFSPRIERMSNQMMETLPAGVGMPAGTGLAVPASAGTVRSNTTAITINDNAAASVYPSTINVSGLPA